MAKSQNVYEPRAIATPDPALNIDLKDPPFAALLAWLVPGLGHIYQGRTGKGILFFVCIIGTFLYGFYIGGGRVVYASTTPSIFSRWQYFCQLGVGLPAMPALVQRFRAMNGNGPLADDAFMRPPGMVGPFQSRDESNNTVVQPDELAKWNHDLGERFEMGTVYTVIAGLLNVLAIFDAYGGPLVFPPDDKKKQPKDDDDKKQDSA
jgi:predicted small lipoprotein YifL